ncbi:MAG: Omp28-related outer membrane protein [Bacteroidia bacterium]
MNKLISALFTAILVLLLASCGGNDPLGPETDAAKLASVPNTGMGLLVKHTGTNCYYCGKWGWKTMEQAIEIADEKMLIIAAYGNHGFGEFFMTDFASQLDNQYGIDAFPTFTANGIRVWPNQSSDDSLGFSMVEQALEIYQNHMDSSLDVGAALNWSVANNVATINARFKFLKDCDGEYYGTVWFDESGMQAYQDGYEGEEDPYHKRVLRTATGGSVFGELFADGKIETNHMVEKSWNIDFPENEWKKENVRATLVIFKKVKDKYKFVNASWAVF